MARRRRTPVVAPFFAPLALISLLCAIIAVVSFAGFAPSCVVCESASAASTLNDRAPALAAYAYGAVQVTSVAHGADGPRLRLRSPPRNSASSR